LGVREKRLIFTPIEQTNAKELARITTWVNMGKYEK
jgi:hypothetical protein